MNANVSFVFNIHTVLIHVPYDGTYDDAVQRAKEYLHHEGVSIDGVQEINVEDCDTFGMVSE